MLNTLLEQLNSPDKPTEINDSVLNLDLFEELNILGKVILNKPTEAKISEK